jgi:hypothetical protein
MAGAVVAGAVVGVDAEDLVGVDDAAADFFAVGRDDVGIDPSETASGVLVRGDGDALRVSDTWPLPPLW